MIELTGLWKTYDTVVAVKDLSLTVAKGTTVGLIGPNGSGKTTLLRMITTLAKPDRGTIHFEGVDIHQSPKVMRQRLAFMPAEFGFPPYMTIYEYMDYFACMAGVPRRERGKMIEQVMELTDLKGREDVSVRGLSTGNKQRLLLAKTLVSDPEILILDEPASGLDPRARVEVREILKTLASMGKTIVVSSHILADLEDICSHICILEAGNLVLSGNIDTLLNDTARTERIVHLDLKPEDRERARKVLLALDGVLGCEITERHLEIGSQEQNCNYILRCLLDEDIEILGMSEDKPDLEDIFIKSTKGEVT